MTDRPVARVESLSELLDRDLEHIRAELQEEYAAMAGGRLLMTGGAGFLGYYMVQGVLHWNDRAAPADRIHVTVFDNYVRGVPEWMESLRGRADLTLVRHDVRHPLPEPMPEFDWIIHAAGIASPTYYRAHPLETMDANIDDHPARLRPGRGAVRRKGRRASQGAHPAHPQAGDHHP